MITWISAMICMVYGWLIKPSKEPISWKYPALISVECSKETLCLAWNFHMSCVSDGRLSLVVCLSLSVCVYLSVCVSLRAFIEFPRDSADGSTGRVLPAVLSVCLCVCLSVSVCLCISVCLCVSQSVHRISSWLSWWFRWSSSACRLRCSQAAVCLRFSISTQTNTCTHISAPF